MDKTERKAIEAERKAIKEIVKNVSNSIDAEQTIKSLRAENERLTAELTKYKGLTDDLYLLLVDDKQTKKLADATCEKWLGKGGE